MRSPHPLFSFESRLHVVTLIIASTFLSATVVLPATVAMPMRMSRMGLHVQIASDEVRYSDSQCASYFAFSPQSQRCSAITKKGTQCSRHARSGSPYCTQHTAVPANQRCKAITKAGSQCKRRVKIGDYCTQHARMR